MAFYETVFIVRQDVSSADVDKIVDDFSTIIKDNAGEVIKTEYWGLRALAYEIANNKKGHYVFIGSKAPDQAIKALEQKVKLSENIIRYMTVKVDSISMEPSAILKVKSYENDEIIDVTITKEDVA